MESLNLKDIYFRTIVISIHKTFFMTKDSKIFALENVAEMIYSRANYFLLTIWNILEIDQFVSWSLRRGDCQMTILNLLS